MLYPVYIRRDRDGTHRATFPDLDSCFSNIRNRDYLSAAFRQTVEIHFRKLGLRETIPSLPRDWMADYRFQGGYWMLMDIHIGDGATAPQRRNRHRRKMIIIDT